MRRPARGDDRESAVIRKSFVYGHFMKSKLRKVAAFCMNKYRTCANCGTELTQACSPSVLLRSYFTESGKAIIVFEAKDRRLRFDLPVPAGSSEKEQRVARQKWRALLLCIKAKLESVTSGIETFEEAFLAHVVLPDGMTVHQHTHARIESAYKGGEMTPLLPAPKGK